jgi:hypothetical protein
VLDVAADVEHDRDRPQRAKDPRRAARVADVDRDAISLRDEHVVLPDVDPAGQDGAEDGIGTFERFPSVERRDDARRRPRLPNETFCRSLGILEPLLVDVHQREGAVLEQRKGENVPNELPGKAEASRPDEGDSRHVFSLRPVQRRAP